MASKTRVVSSYDLQVKSCYVSDSADYFLAMMVFLSDDKVTLTLAHLLVLRIVGSDKLALFSGTNGASQGTGSHT